MKLKWNCLIYKSFLCENILLLDTSVIFNHFWVTNVKKIGQKDENVFSKENNFHFLMCLLLSTETLIFLLRNRGVIFQTEKISCFWFVFPYDFYFSCSKHVFLCFLGKVENEYAIEVGPGPGGITRAILDAKVKELHVIEKDPRFIPALNLIRESVGSNRLHVNIGDCLHFNVSSK